VSVATIKVKAFSVLRDVFGAGVIELEVGPAENLAGVFDAMFAKFGKPLRDVLIDPETGDMTPFLLVLNGEAISSTRDRERSVKSGDEITIIFPIGGG
jgi:molybdopterin converting factor small subunit